MPTSDAALPSESATPDHESRLAAGRRGATVPATVTAWFERHSTLMAVVLLLGFVVLCAVSVYRDTLTTDEADHLLYGRQVLEGGPAHMSMQRMPVTALNAIPLLLIRAAGLPMGFDEALWWCRLVTVFFAALLGWAVFAWSRALYGARGGLLSLFLFVFCPTTIAHSRLVTNDLYCALFAFLAVFGFVRYQRTWSWPRLLAAAAAMGLAQLTKHTALLLFPLLFLVLCTHLWATRRAQSWRWLRKRLALHGLAYVVIVTVIINAGYSFNGSLETLATHNRWIQEHYPLDFAAPAHRLTHGAPTLLERVPLPLPRAYVEAFILGQHYNKTGGGHGPNYLLGRFSQFGWWYYFPVAFALKTPLPTLGLLGLALVVFFRAKRCRLGSDEVTLLFLAATIFAFFCLFCSAQIGVRYLLPALPGLYVFAGQLAVWNPASGRRLWTACRWGLGVWLPLSVGSYFPHYLCYFNEVGWDRLHLYRYLADSNLDWGQAGYYRDQFLQAHRGESVAVNPRAPVTGLVVVSVNDLVGLNLDCPPSAYDWLRDHFTPKSHLGYAWLVYEIPRNPPPAP